MEGLQFPVEVLDVDDESSQDIASNLNIKGVPTLVFLKDGVEVNRTVGLISRQKLEHTIEKTYGTELSN